MKFESGAVITGEPGGYAVLQRKIAFARRFVEAQEELPVTRFDYEAAVEGVYDESHIPEIDVAQEFDQSVPDWQLHIQEIVPNTWLEKARAVSTTEAISHGIEHPEDYETFHYKERIASGAKKVWLSFPGLQAGHQAAEKDLDKIDAHSMIPDEGVGVTFFGPSGIAGITPEQCMECTDRVFEAVNEILRRYPDYEINVIGFSAGTHLAHHVANQLGEAVGEQVVKKMVTISSGLGIGLGIYSTKVTEPLQEELYEQGIDKYLYTAAIKGYNQLDNVQWIPKGENFRTFMSPGDKFIPPKLEGGSLDYVEFLKAEGVIEDEETSVRKIRPFGTDGDHVSVVGAIVLSKLLGYDPYGFGAPDKTHFKDSDFAEQYYNKVEERLDQLTDDEMRVLLKELGNSGSGFASLATGVRPWHELSEDEQAVVNVLSRKKLLNIVTSGRNTDYVTLTIEAQEQYFAQPVKTRVQAFWQDERSLNGVSKHSNLIARVASVSHIDVGTTYKYPPTQADAESNTRVEADEI